MPSKEEVKLRNRRFSNGLEESQFFLEEQSRVVVLETGAALWRGQCRRQTVQDARVVVSAFVQIESLGVPEEVLQREAHKVVGLAARYPVVAAHAGVDERLAAVLLLHVVPCRVLDDVGHARVHGLSRPGPLLLLEQLADILHEETSAIRRIKHAAKNASLLRFRRITVRQHLPSSLPVLLVACARALEWRAQKW